jgi:hypothetical protein
VIFASQDALPVSTTPVVNFAPGTAGVADTGGKFSTGDNDTGSKFAAGVSESGKLPLVSPTLGVNLPPVW